MRSRDWVRARRIVHETDTQAFILSYDWAVCQESRYMDKQPTLLDKYLPRSEWSKINDLSAEWGMKWYLQPGLQDKMMWSDINLASVVQYSFHYTLNTILRLNSIMTRLIDDQKPDRLELFLRDWVPRSIVPNENEPLLELVAIHVASQQGVEVVNYAKDEIFTNTVCWGFAKAKNMSRSILREAQKIASRLSVSVNASPPASKTDISQHALFVESARSIAEITQAFQEGDSWDSLCVAFGRQSNSTTVRYKDMMGSTSLKMSSVYQRANRFFAGQHAAIRSSLAESRFFTSYGVDLLPVLEHWIEYLIHTEYPRLALNIEAAEKILRDYQPDVVLADNSLLELGRMFLLLARKHDVLTIELQHGLLFDIIVLAFPEHYITERNIFWGELDRDKQIARNGEPSRFTLGGSARFDTYFSYLNVLNTTDHSNKQPLRIGVTCERQYKFYGLIGVHNTMEAIYSKYYQYIIEAARKMPEVIFSFKTKNRSILPLLRDHIVAYGIENYEIVETVRFEEWFSSLSALITDYSTMGLEAMIFDVPVLILNLTGWDDPVGFESSMAVDVVQTAEELYQALSDNMENPDRLARQRAEFLRYALADTEGTAAKKTAGLIAELISKRKSIKNRHV